MPQVTVIIPTLPVSDLARSHRFYTEVLGFVVPWGWGDPPIYGGVQATEGSAAAIHLSVKQGAFEPGEAYVIVDDVDACFAQVRAAGGTFRHEVGDRDYGMRDFMVEDPDGNLISFATDISAGAASERGD